MSYAFQQQYIYVANNTGTPLLRGEAVRISETQQYDDKVSVVRSISDQSKTNPTNSNKFIGLVAHDIPNGQFGYVITYGLLKNTNTTTYTPGGSLYVSSTTSGSLTQNKPTSPFITIKVGTVLTTNSSSGDIFVQPNEPIFLDDISNITSSFSSPSASYAVTASYALNTPTSNGSAQGTQGDIQFRGQTPGSFATSAFGYLNWLETNNTKGNNRSGSLTIGPAGAAIANNPLSVNHNINDYAQTNAQNLSNGAFASTDIVATANNGSDSNYYIDMGINGSNYNDPSFNIGGANDGYIYVAGGALSIGTDSNKSITFHTNGNTSSNRKLQITGNGSVVQGGPTQLPLSSTDGFMYIASTAGAPIGTPTSQSFSLPVVIDSTNSKLYFYSGGKWNNVTSLIQNIKTITASYTITLNDDIIVASGGGPYNITLPTAVGNTKSYVIKSMVSGGTVTIMTTSSQLIDAATFYNLNGKLSITVRSTGTQWIITSNFN